MGTLTIFYVAIVLLAKYKVDGKMIRHDDHFAQAAKG